MLSSLSRRELFYMSLGASAIRAQVPLPVRSTPSAVSLVHGEDRRKNIHDALVAVDDQIRPVLKRKKYVIIKPNCVSVNVQLATTHADALRGILDYLAPRFKGPIVIAESSQRETHDAFENFHYNQVVAEHRSQKVSLVDLNDEGKYEVLELVDAYLHMSPIRLAARLMDPDAFIISAARLKAHDVVVATLSVKNLAVGAALHSTPKDSKPWHDKFKYHTGYRQTHVNIFLTAQKLRPFWGAAVIDGFEGMEGDGPFRGTPVESRVAIASTDLVAADRIAAETMGVNPEWLGYLQYCDHVGLGNYDPARIDLRGVSIASVKKTYRLHKDVEQQLKWLGPMTPLPPLKANPA